MTNQRRVAVQIGLDQPYKRHVRVFAGIHEYAKQHGWHLVIDEWAGYALPVSVDESVPYDGIVGRITATGAERAKRLRLPVVSVHYSSPAVGVPGVYPDYSACGKLRAEHLLARGFLHFGVLLHKFDRADLVEGAAFKQTLHDAGGESYHELVLKGNWSSRQDSAASYRRWLRAIRAIDQWMDGWDLPIGLYIRDIDIARLVIEKCANRGLRVPEDVAIVAGNNEEELCERPEPGITSLEVPNERIGFEAARLLDRLIDASHVREPVGGGRKTGGKIAVGDPLLLPPVGIVGRRSTDFYAVDDELVRRALRFLDENLHAPISIDDVARALDVSRRKLTERFRLKLKRTVASEVKRLRIERVRRELMGTEQPVHEIANRTGFGSIRTLNSVFRAEVGCSPTEYRRQSRM